MGLGQGAEEVAAAEGALALGEALGPGEGGGDLGALALVGKVGAGAVEQAGDLRAAEAVLGRAGAPVGLGHLAADHRLAVAGLALGGADGGEAARAAGAHELGDLGVAGREVLEDGAGDAGKLGGAVRDRAPLRPRARG